MREIDERTRELFVAIEQATKHARRLGLRNHRELHGMIRAAAMGDEMALEWMKTKMPDFSIRPAVDDCDQIVDNLPSTTGDS